MIVFQQNLTKVFNYIRQEKNICFEIKIVIISQIWKQIFSRRFGREENLHLKFLLHSAWRKKHLEVEAGFLETSQNSSCIHRDKLLFSKATQHHLGKNLFKFVNSFFPKFFTKFAREEFMNFKESTKRISCLRSFSSPFSFVYLSQTNFKENETYFSSLLGIALISPNSFPRVFMKR